jgi:hypothetical protein
MTRHTLADKVLCAALALDTIYPRFTAADLAVRAWLDDKEAFGLAGYEESQCDCNAVNVTIMGRRGLPAKGLLAKHGRHYSITTAGRKRARILMDLDKPPPAPVRKYVVLDEVEADEVCHFLDSVAWEKRHDRAGITREDCRDFAGMNHSVARMFLEHVAKRLANAPAVLPGGREVAAGDIAELLDLHRWLVGRFAPREMVKA